MFADLAGIVPRFCFYDPRRSVLATELVDGAETIAEHHFRNNAFPVELAEQLGQAFGNYHRKAAASPPPNLDGLFLWRPAWALSLHSMPFEAPSLSGGIHQMLGMVRQFPQFATALDALRSGWRPDAVIHGDIKWDNCILCPGSNGHAGLKIVDWEMADWGDSCWDVAGIVSAYLSFWVQSLPGDNMADPGAMVAQARYPVERMQPAIQSFWAPTLAAANFPEKTRAACCAGRCRIRAPGSFRPPSRCCKHPRRRIRAPSFSSSSA